MIKRRWITLFLTLILASSSISCSKENNKTLKPTASHMKSICELATIECYFNNVAKYEEKDAQGFLFWKKDKKFWIEYSGIVKMGIDASLLVIDVKEDVVTIKIPKAKVLSQEVDKESLTKESYIVDEKSADTHAVDGTLAFKEAQNNMLQTASNNTALLASAQERAQILIEEYIKNIGEVVGKEYAIDWIYLNEDGSETSNTNEEPSDTGEKEDGSNNS